MSLNQPAFLTTANYQNIVGFLRKHYAGRMGTNSVPERIDGRIQKTVQHFMTEVAKVHGTGRPVQQLDQEVVKAATQSLDDWLRRQEPVQHVRPPPMAALAPPVVPKAQTVSTAAYSRPQVPATPTGVPVSRSIGVGGAAGAGAAAAYDEMSALFDRTQGGTSLDSWPAPIEEEQEDPVLLMKKAQKAREAEMLTGKTAPRMEVAELATISVDPTPQAEPPPIRTAPLPQDYIIPQEPIVKYRNTEYNIFLTSSDRDWFRNRTENRYNFSVQFNPGNRTGYGYSPSVQERFRNIERIEFVKAIVPTESLTQLIRSTARNGSGELTYNRDRVVNVLSMPFAGVRIAELNNNGFSTNPREDNTFALVQYDATWNSATALNIAPSGTTLPAKTTVGYTALIPKFLKSQRVYEPTPLAGLQKLTFRMEAHNGDLLSNDSDVLGIQRICLSSETSNIGTGTTNYSGATNEYIFIQTDKYFPGSAVSEGDLINIQGYVVSATGGGTNPAESTRLDFENFINSPGAINVVAIAYVDLATGAITEGVNEAGYANIIVVRSRFADPTTGAINRAGAYFGGSTTEEGYLGTRINGQPSTASAAALINLSRQTHFVLRVVTRDMDSASNIRPDNV